MSLDGSTKGTACWSRCHGRWSCARSAIGSPRTEAIEVSSRACRSCSERADRRGWNAFLGTAHRARRKLEVVPSRGGVMDVKGKTVVVTGVLAALKRDEVELALKALGARVSGSVSSKTDILFVGTQAGS